MPKNFFLTPFETPAKPAALLDCYVELSIITNIYTQFIRNLIGKGHEAERQEDGYLRILVKYTSGDIGRVKKRVIFAGGMGVSPAAFHGRTILRGYADGRRSIVLS